MTGPDEYTALVDNNVFTNLMAARNLRAAADAAGRHPDRAVELRIEDAELATWRAAADAIVVPFDATLGVTAQSEGFTRYRHWNFAATDTDEYPLLLHYPYYLLYTSQVVKQADLVFALYVCGDCFSAEQKQRDFDHYEPITVRDSSLSASIQAVMAAEVGHLDLAYDYFRETSLIDLRDRAGNTDDGLHLASLAGAWLVAVAGFGGLRDHGDMLAFAPRLPAALTRLCFRLLYRGRRLLVDLQADQVRYELTSGEELELLHHGEAVIVSPGAPRRLPYPPPVSESRVSPPPGRQPRRPDGSGIASGGGAESSCEGRRQLSSGDRSRGSVFVGRFEMHPQSATGTPRVIGDQLVDDDLLTCELSDALRDSEVKVTDRVGVSEHGRLKRAVP